MGPSMQQNVGTLKAVVIGLGIAILVALAFLVYGLMTRLGPATAVSSLNAEIILPPGAEILEAHMDQARVSLRLKVDGAEQLRLYDAATGKALGIITLKSAAAK